MMSMMVVGLPSALLLLLILIFRVCQAELIIHKDVVRHSDLVAVDLVVVVVAALEFKRHIVNIIFPFHSKQM